MRNSCDSPLEFIERKTPIAYTIHAHKGIDKNMSTHFAVQLGDIVDKTLEHNKTLLIDNNLLSICFIHLSVCRFLFLEVIKRLRRKIKLQRVPLKTPFCTINSR